MDKTELAATAIEKILFEDEEVQRTPEEVMAVRKRVELIDLPPNVSGKSCGTCEYIDADHDFCTHPEVKVPVNDRQGCKLWDAPGVGRPWEGKEARESVAPGSVASTFARIRRLPGCAAPSESATEMSLPNGCPAPSESGITRCLLTEGYKYASLQFDLPDWISEHVAAFAKSIPDEDLAEGGREKSPHITIRYGIEDETPRKVREVVSGWGAIRVVLGMTSYFPADDKNDNADVLKISVDSPYLVALSAKVAADLPVTDTHPDYRPHVTVARLKPGLGKKYENNRQFEGCTLVFSEAVFSARSGKQTTIPLCRDMDEATRVDEAVEEIQALLETPLDKSHLIFDKTKHRWIDPHKNEHDPEPAPGGANSASPLVQKGAQPIDVSDPRWPQEHRKAGHGGTFVDAEGSLRKVHHWVDQNGENQVSAYKIKSNEELQRDFARGWSDLSEKERQLAHKMAKHAFEEAKEAKVVSDRGHEWAYFRDMVLFDYVNAKKWNEELQKSKGIDKKNAERKSNALATIDHTIGTMIVAGGAAKSIAAGHGLTQAAANSTAAIVPWATLAYMALQGIKSPKRVLKAAGRVVKRHVESAASDRRVEHRWLAGRVPGGGGGTSHRGEGNARRGPKDNFPVGSEIQDIYGLPYKVVGRFPGNTAYRVVQDREGNQKVYNLRAKKLARTRTPPPRPYQQTESVNSLPDGLEVPDAASDLPNDPAIRLERLIETGQDTSPTTLLSPEDARDVIEAFDDYPDDWFGVLLLTATGETGSIEDAITLASEVYDEHPSSDEDESKESVDEAERELAVISGLTLEGVQTDPAIGKVAGYFIIDENGQYQRLNVGP